MLKTYQIYCKVWFHLITWYAWSPPKILGYYSWLDLFGSLPLLKSSYWIKQFNTISFIWCYHWTNKFYGSTFLKCSHWLAYLDWYSRFILNFENLDRFWFGNYFQNLDRFIEFELIFWTSSNPPKTGQNPENLNLTK